MKGVLLALPELEEAAALIELRRTLPQRWILPSKWTMNDPSNARNWSSACVRMELFLIGGLQGRYLDWLERLRGC